MQSRQSRMDKYYDSDIDIDESSNIGSRTSRNKELYKEISKNAIETYEKNFVAEKIYSELVDYLEEIGGCKK